MLRSVSAAVPRMALQSLLLAAAAAAAAVYAGASGFAGAAFAAGNGSVPEPLAPRNVRGEELTVCSTSPMTGFYRDGFCNTGPGDRGTHTVCAQVRGCCCCLRCGGHGTRAGRLLNPCTEPPVALVLAPGTAPPRAACAQVTQEFLDYTLRRGNDLMTPRPEYRFPGLKPGDGWCLCASRWREALAAGVAPPVILAASHEKTLQYVGMPELQRNAAGGSSAAQ